MAQSKNQRDVKDFVAKYVPSVEHLEVLALLQRNPTKSWNPVEVAAELRIRDVVAADVLERLASDNFLSIQLLNDVSYRFSPVSATLSEAAARCIDTYRREPIAVIRLIMSGASEPIRDFARAFRIKQDKSSG